MSLMIDPYRFADAFPTPTAIFASDPMLSSGWEQVSGPAGFYESGAGKTYIAWQYTGLAGYKGIHIAAYDHGAGTWGERYTVGNFLLADDDHGHPALVRDANGYIHCFFGSHNNLQKWSVTNSPDDISAWTQQADLGSVLTYPKAVLVGSTLYLFVRDGTTSARRKLAYATMTPTSGVGTWSSLQMIVDYGADSRVYTSGAHVRGTEIHFVCCYTTDSDLSRTGVYYYVLDTTTGSVKNYNGTTTVTSGSLPVTKAQSDSSFRIFDHGSNDGDIASLQFDSSGNAHVLFADGTTPNYDLKHMMLSGGSWSSPTTIASVTDISGSTGYVGNYTLVPGASGKMEAWYNASNGDKMRRVRNASGTWTSAKVIKAAGAYDFVQAQAVRNAHADFRTLFSENSGTLLDSSAANVGLYAYGDSGPINASLDMSAVDTAGWSNVVLLLGANHRNNATSIIDESKSAVRVALSGNAKIDTSQSPFAGRASIRLDGSGDFVTVLNNAAFSVSGTSDFCMDAWVRLNETGRLQVFFGKRAPGASGSEFSFYMSATNKLGFVMNSAGAAVLSLVGTTSMTTGVWYFIEVSRISSVTYLFLGTLGGSAVLEASGTQSAAPASGAQALLIGRDPSNTVTRDFNGWIIPRFTRAGRHSSGFTVPTSPFPRR